MTFEIYQDTADEWRWRAKSGNGHILADSGEGYTRKASARRAIRKLIENVIDLGDPWAPYIVEIL